LNPSENEERVKAALVRHPGLSLEKEWSTPPDSPWREFFYGVL
jgi:16S rRNA (cytosine967-C5)-methyltransferase